MLILIIGFYFPKSGLFGSATEWGAFIIIECALELAAFVILNDIKLP